MSLVVNHPAYLQIEDQIDRVGQKYRAQRIVRGAMLCIATVILLSLAAALGAHFARQSAWTMAILLIWGTSILAAAIGWFFKPLLIRPDPLAMAGLIESRIGGLHNGLTNSLLLARRGDIAASPWLAEIYREISDAANRKPLASAVRLGELRMLGIWLSALVVPALLVAAVFRGPLAHGWHQLFNPASFVPTMGKAAILQVEPGDVTLVAGQPLEISATVNSPGEPRARLIFESKPGSESNIAAPAGAQVMPRGIGEANNAGLKMLTYGYRLDHVDAPLRYRIEVAGTQSPWYAVSVVRQVRLTELRLRIVPPMYTNLQEKLLVLKADDIARTPLVLAQGSRVELTATVDVPVGGAMLQLGNFAPQPLEADRVLGGRRFAGSFSVLDDTALTLLLTEGAHQVIARVPAEPLTLHCTRDLPPNVQMIWPTQDVTVPLGQELRVRALLRDDYGLTSARLLASHATGEPQKMKTIHEQQFGRSAGVKAPVEFSFILPVDAAKRKQGASVQIQVEATDNRRLPSLSGSDGGPQTTTTRAFQITFQDPAELARQQLKSSLSLREKLMEMLRLQQDLYEQTGRLMPGDSLGFRPIAEGQGKLRDQMQTTARTFPFTPDELKVQKALLMLSMNEAHQAVELASAMQSEPLPKQRARIALQLRSHQQQIINLLSTLLNASEPTTQPDRTGSEIPSEAEAFNKLDEALKQYVARQQKILHQTAALAKKPVDHWDDADRKRLDELKQAQDNLDQFMQQQIKELSKLVEQDMADTSVLRQLLEISSEVTMARDALRQQATEISVRAQDMGLELAKELTSNIEKWLSNAPDRTKWLQEDPLSKVEVPLAPLPGEIEDMIGKLLEQEEDLFDQVEDQDANWMDSADKGIGWDAMDGPIANMTAKGVSGNVLPNNNRMNGRSGEGRSGRSEGEMVQDHAAGKTGRRTPTRVDPTPFQKGQVKDSGSESAGGATGGGKISGLGAQGLGGPTPPAQKQPNQRLAQKQAEIRNAAESLHARYQLGRYDNFRLLDAIALMRRVESDLRANRYQNAMRRRGVLLGDLDASRLLVGSQVYVQRDASPAIDRKTRQQIDDAMKGELPPAWSEALKEYYRKLSQE